MTNPFLNEFVLQPRNQNRNQNNNQNQETNTELFIAQLGAFGGLISTVGGIISTAAAFLALQELEDEIANKKNANSNSNSKNNSNSDIRIKELENQVYYLMKEIEKLKKSKGN